MIHPLEKHPVTEDITEVSKRWEKCTQCRSCKTKNQIKQKHLLIMQNILAQVYISNTTSKILSLFFEISYDKGFSTQRIIYLERNQNFPKNKHFFFIMRTRSTFWKILRSHWMDDSQQFLSSFHFPSLDLLIANSWFNYTIAWNILMSPMALFWPVYV